MTPAPVPTSRFADRFPDPTARAVSWRHRARRRGVFVAVLAVVIAGGLLVSQAFGSSGPDYRTALVADRAVDATLQRVGTIEPVSQASVAFPVAGTVAGVSVQVGDSVGVGSPLASLDTSSLAATLHQKQAALAQAQLTLTKALAGQSVGTPSVSTGGGGGSGGSGSQATFQSARTTTGNRIVLTAATSSNPQIAAAQQAVLAAQQQVDAALQTASTALQTAQSVCANVSSTPPSQPQSTSTPSTGTAGDSGSGGTTAPTTQSTPPPDNTITACQSALNDVLTAQNAVAGAQKQLSDASNNLDDLLNQQAATPPPTTPPPTTPPPTTPPSAPSTPSGANNGSANNGSVGSGGSSGFGGSSGSGRSGSSGGATASGASGGFGSSGGRQSGGSSAGASPTAADLAAYQQDVDAATDAVAVAQQAMDQATITSPIAGTVVAVNMKPGDSVGASSTTSNVVVQGPGGYEVSTDVGVDQISHVAVGQAASVVPDGTHSPITGKVTSVSVAPDPNSSGTTTNYLVVIGLTDPNSKLNNGGTGSVSIVTQSAASALAVPTSAVTTVGGRHSVLVVNGGSTQRVNVQVGAVGTQWTEITSGLQRGDQVALADMSAALPGSATASSSTTGANGTVGGFGGFGGFAGRGGLGGGGGGGGGGTGRGR